MVSAYCILVICCICAGLNCLALPGGALTIFLSPPFPYARWYSVLDLATTVISLAADAVLIQITQSPPQRWQADLWKDAMLKMKLALCAKLLVIVLQYFPYLLYYYQLFNNNPFRSPEKTWEDYVKKAPPLDFVLSRIGSFYIFTILYTIVTAVKIVVLYAIHDFYEGVKQQGTFATNGLLDVYEPQGDEDQAAQPALPSVGGGFRIPGPMAAAGPPAGTYAPMGGYALMNPYAPAGPYAMPYQYQPPQQAQRFPSFYYMNIPGSFQQVAPQAGSHQMAPSAGFLQMAPQPGLEQVAPPDGIRQRQKSAGLPPS